MAYNKTNWQNAPSTDTPINRANMNKIEEGIYQNSIDIESILPKGMIVPYAGSSAPNGWLICDGSTISRTTYQGLYQVIGTTYGSGDGSTTFNLPDLQGKVIVGIDSEDEDFDTLGETGGEKTQELRAWIGAVNGNTNAIGYNAQTAVPDSSYNNNLGSLGSGIGTVNSIQHSVKVTKSNGDSSSLLQPYTVVNYIIKY